MKIALSFLLVFCISVLATNAFAQESSDKTDKDAPSVPKALDFEMDSIDGTATALKKYEGKVVLVVNTASKCGLTPQYEGLQKLHDTYSEKGLVILGFPCNQFGKQEPGTDSQIDEFCQQNYGVKFQMFSKIDVNGRKRTPLYKHLTSLDLKPVGKGKITWNFEKFILDRNGKPIGRFSPRTKPNDPKFEEVIKRALGE